MTYAKRKIDITINAAKGQFGDGRGDDVVLSGYRVSGSFSYMGGYAQANAHIGIVGLPLPLILQLTGTGINARLQRDNKILVAAGDEGGAMSTVYTGSLWQAYADFSTAPNVVFNIIGSAASYAAVRPVNASSFIGYVDAAQVMQTFADELKIPLVNNGVSVKLASPYYPGSTLQKIRDCAKEAGINFSIEFNTLKIWPRNSAINGEVIKIDKNSGLVGYPNFNSFGITFSCIFNPNMVLARQVNLQSDIIIANGVWNIVTVSHNIESETPGGQWITTVQCIRPPQ